MIKYLRNMTRAFKSGVLLPKAANTQPAPSGTTEIPVQGGLFKRLRHEKDWFRISRHKMTTANIDKPMSILHITDVHLRNNDNWLEQLMETMSGLEPDVVALTGDIVAPGWTNDAFEAFMSALPSAKMGRFAAIGNWDNWAVDDKSKWSDRYAAHHVDLLINEWRPIDGWCIAGVDDLLSGNPEPQKLIDSLPNTPTIVLNHCPGLFPQLARQPVKLVLSGHAHGGQVRLPFIGPLWTPKGSGKTVAGWSKQNTTHLFVSRGVGWSVAPLRLLCPPELAWIDILPKEGPI